MKKFPLLFVIFFTFVPFASAETAPLSVSLPEKEAWIGQRLPFFIELRAPGSFVGAASFDLPQVPGAIIIKIGSPVVSSENIDDQSWFIQMHEFALFSQKTGVVEVPPFPVRYASREGFSGPASDVTANFPGMKVAIERPPGSEYIDFLITTESLEITETWMPKPGSAQAGAIFKRTISQSASQLSGMALSPAPDKAPDGIKVYTEDPITQDKTDRGDFTGERSETVVYQVTKAGSFTLPEVVYVWWNPKTKIMEKTILPATNFTITAAPASTSASDKIKVTLVWLILPLLIIIFAVWQRTKILSRLKQWWKVLHSADKVLAKKLIRACNQNNSVAAWQAWAGWRNTQDLNFQPGHELQSAILILQRYLFGPTTSEVWRGEDLGKVFTNHLKRSRRKVYNKKISALPKLNM